MVSDISLSKMYKQISANNNYKQEMQNDVHIVFQPIHDTSTECLIGAECLMRWSMGGNGITCYIYPDYWKSWGNKFTLFPLSQIRRLLSELDTEAIIYGFYLFSINISVIEILDMNFEKKLLSVLAEYHL
ncbi:EAL domain-containing protein [Pseudoalteromonas aurantia]|nr:EAL domain-containing protein [Pseudoalteromonas aurantia]